jgi:glycosyltransferase involved in cell wall biosynthesis
MTLMQPDERTRVGFLLEPDTWVGGRNYFRNLLIAFAQLPDPEIEPFVFTSKEDDTALAGIPAVKVVRTSMMDRRTLPWLARKITAKALAGDWMLQRLLNQKGIAVLSHRGPLVPNSSIPSVGWIPDFQHVHLPAFFGERDRRERDRDFMDLCRKCDKVIVSSECARLDLQAFAPQYAGKAEVLHFVASPAEQGILPLLPELRQRYGFEGPYFLLPNQFWAHKNHRIVVKALQLLKQRHQRVLVLATGETKDRRHPEFFDSLMRYATECDVLDLFRVLGVIPFNDLSGLMVHAVALINPSKFEGWSTSVEESKSLGKRILLSDIPVHREQAPALGVYFSPDDAEGLARGLCESLENFDTESDFRIQESTRVNLRSKQVQFAETFQQIVLSTGRQ